MTADTSREAVEALMKRLKAIAEGPLYGGTAAEAISMLSSLLSERDERQREGAHAIKVMRHRLEAAEAARAKAEEERNLVLKAVMYHFGPEGMVKVCDSVLAARTGANNG